MGVGEASFGLKQLFEGDITLLPLAHHVSPSFSVATGGAPTCLFYKCFGIITRHKLSSSSGCLPHSCSIRPTATVPRD